MTKIAPALLALCASALPAAAQQDDVLGTVILGGLIPLDRPAYSRAYSVDIVSGDELREAGDISVAEFLGRRAGISFSRSGPIGGTTTLRVRGLGSQYVAVRIDGIDVTDPSNPQIFYDFGQLTTSGISRIEILKGSQSAAYGSEAVGGVINIITARPDEDGTVVDAEVEAGSFDTWRGEVGVRSRIGRGELALSLSRITTDGFSARDEDLGNDEDDGFAQTFATLYGAVQVTDDLRLGASAFVRDTEAEFDEFGGDGTPDELADTRSRGARAFAQLYAFGVEHELSFARFDIDRTSRSNGVEDVFEGDRGTVTYTGSTLIGGTTLAFGAEATEESYAAGGRDGDQETVGAFVEAIAQVTPAMELALAARYDWHSDFDDFVSGRLALAYDVTPALTLRGVAATGFRAPSLFERFSIYGSPDLDPEDSRTLELGADLRLDRGTLAATAFYTEIDDLIGFEGASYTQVPGTTRTHGLEIAGEVDLTERVTLVGAYTYTETQDAAGDRLVRVPRHDLSLGLDAEITGQLRGRLVARHVADVIDAAFDPPAFERELVPLDDYTVADASLTYRLRQGPEAFLRVENILNEDYQTVRGFGTAGRSFYAGLRASF